MPRRKSVSAAAASNCVSEIMHGLMMVHDDTSFPNVLIYR